jgi:general secretion pathway protein G
MELMVVVIILAVLAALIVPRIIGRQEDAKRAKAASDIASLRSALDLFRMDNDRYPSMEEGLQALREAPSDARNWRGPYLERPVPPDPWGNPYVYEWPGPDGEQSFTLLSYGPDGQPSEDDITEGYDE